MYSEYTEYVYMYMHKYKDINLIDNVCKSVNFVT